MSSAISNGQFSNITDIRSSFDSDSPEPELESKVEFDSFKMPSNDSIWKKVSYPLENQYKNVELSKASSSKFSENEDQIDDFENIGELIEIGPPNILKFKSKINEIACHFRVLSSDMNSVYTIINETEEFFSMNLSEYLNGSLKCGFCQCPTLKWPSFNLISPENFCCSDYREYVQGLIDHKNSKKIALQTITIDNYRSPLSLKKIAEKKKLVEKKIAELRKMEIELQNFRIEKQLRFSNTIKSESIKQPSLVIKKSLPNINEEKSIRKIDNKRESKSTDLASTAIISLKSEEKAKDRINYSLSNIRYIENGWTVIHRTVESPIVEEKTSTVEEDISIPIFDLKEIIPMQFNKTTIKYYKSGGLFELILSDNTGSIYYPNGDLAIIISANNDFRTFIVFSEKKKTSIPLAYFDSNGNGFCNYLNGKLRSSENLNFSLRLQLNSCGGINFDEKGFCLKRWLWPSQTKSHIFSPIIFRLNEYMSVKIHNKFKIVLQFRFKQSKCKFKVSCRSENIKANKSSSDHFRPMMIDKTCIKLKEKADLLLRVLAKGYPNKTEEELVQKMISNSEDSYYIKLPKIQESKASSQNNTSRESFNHSSILSTNREKMLLEPLEKKNSIIFSLQELNIESSYNF